MRKIKFTVIGLLLLAIFWVSQRQVSNQAHRPLSAASLTPAAPPAPGPTAPPVAANPPPHAVIGKTVAQPIAGASAPTIAGAPSLPPALVDGKISEPAIQQILALEDDKRGRSPAQNKMDSQLIYAERQSRHAPIAKGVNLREIPLDRDAAGRVLVDIKANVSAELLATITSAGGNVLSSFAQYHAIRAAVPLAQISNLAGRTDVTFIGPAAQAVANTGSVNSEGDIAMKANVARATYGVNGTGVKVGVLSDSVDFLAQAQASSDLGAVTVLSGQAGTGEGEGTAMLEIVHDLAPGASLFFATGFTSEASMANNIRQLRAAGCDIIVDDVEYRDDPPFQDGILAQAVNDVTASGALFFSSASNAGNKNDGTSGTWEGDYADGGQLISPITGQGRAHSFGGANANQAATGGDHKRADLFWADPLGHATDDYDLYVLDSTGTTIVSASTTMQNGTQDPYEGVGKLDDGQLIVVVQFSGAGRFLHLSTGRGRLSINTAGSTKGHSAAVNAFSVAAVSAANNTPFTPANKTEANFSDGLRRMFFNVDGTPFTPGNFSSTGGIVRQKPDIAAADGVHTTLPTDSGLNPFYGTSAAAPHAGAVAALVKSYNPALTPAQMRTILTTGTLDIEAPGVDRMAGYGLLMSDLAFQAAASPQPPTITGFNPASGSAGTTVVITGTKFDAAVAVKFNGVGAAYTVNSASQITATVPPGATTGVISVITSGGTGVSAANFTVVTTPTISSFTPGSGNVGTSVIISGANLNGATTVAFGGVSAVSFTVNSSSQITATVPAAAVTGKLAVTTPSGTTQSAAVFTVTALPVISSFTPASGAVGGGVVIAGANFSGVSGVSFSNVSAPGFVVNSAAQITATLPAGASTGPIRVTTGAGTGVSSNSFVVVPAPVISSLSPASGFAGTSVTISGNNFTGASAVTFNGVNASSFSVTAATQVIAIAPNGVTTGSLRVTTPGGTAVSASVFTVITAAANDNFASAQVISGASGSVGGNNVAATKEPGEPNHAGNAGGRSIWYKWVAPSAGTWEFDTVGSSFDSIMAIYTGSTVANLTAITFNDDITTGVNTNSRVAFVAAAGATYFIAVDGFAVGVQSTTPTASGTVVLHWATTTAVPAISGFSPGSGAVGASVVITGANFTGATSVSFNGVAATFTVNSSTQITATVPPAVTGSLTVTSPGGTAASVSVFTILNGGNNDNFANAFVLAGGNGATNGNSSTATKEVNEPAHAGNPGGKSVWFNWTAPASGAWIFDTSGSQFDTELAVYTGAAVGNLSVVASNDDWNATSASHVMFNAVSGTTYRVAIDGFGGLSGDYNLTWTFSPNAPSISGFSPPSGAVGATVTINGANLNGAIGVRFNGVSAVTFTGVSVNQVTAVVPIGAATGFISLSTSNGVAQSGNNFVVTGGQQGNDNFANRLAIIGAPNTVTGANFGATKEAGEPSHAGNSGGASVWWTWTAPSTGTFTVTTRDSDFDTTLGVYTGTAVAGLTTIASNDDGTNMGTASLVSFNATSGVTYQIAVDGFNGQAGNIALSIYPTVQPQTIFYTGFESAEGYNSSFTLAGQNGWVGSGNGQNGLLFNNFGDNSQQGYLGFSGSTPGGSLFVYHPLAFTPDTNTRPVVRFSTYLRIFDSSNNHYDDFGWIVHNQSGQQLFYFDLSNLSRGIYFLLNDGQGYHNTGFNFQNGQIYYLEIVMDFGHNLWGASMNGASIVQGQPISAVGGVAQNLGDISALWIQSAGGGGNDYMVFDNYYLRAESGQTPNLITPPQSRSVVAGGNATFIVVADSGLPLSYQWRFNGVNIVGANAPVLKLNNVDFNQGGSYSVIVSNAAGVITPAASLVVTEQPNLANYKPAGWSDKIILATNLNHTLDAAIIYAHQNVYLGWSALNATANYNITNRFFTQLYLDGALNYTWFTDSLLANNFVYVSNFNLGTLTIGSHTVRIDTDTTGVFAESNEGDNSYTKTFIVSSTNNVSPKLGSFSRAANGSVSLSLNGIPLRKYEIQVSTNLVAWSVLTTLTNTNGNGVLQYTDPSAPAFTRRFYRGHLLPP